MSDAIAVLTYLYSSFLELGHTVTIPHPFKQGWPREGFDLEVVVVGIVHDAAIERFAGSLFRTSE